MRINHNLIYLHRTRVWRKEQEYSEEAQKNIAENLNLLIWRTPSGQTSYCLLMLETCNSTVSILFSRFSVGSVKRAATSVSHTHFYANSLSWRFSLFFSFCQIVSTGFCYARELQLIILGFRIYSIFFCAFLRLFCHFLTTIYLSSRLLHHHHSANSYPAFARRSFLRLLRISTSSVWP